MSLDKEAPQSVILKRMEFVALKAAILQVRAEHAFSERLACRLMTMAVSSYCHSQGASCT
ncbi:MAG TPA: hypothetical protein VN946_21675 [Terriglobales bacterium]|jgi:hypothetical protein|nr:hypothetical protein [Terriglobales bacterium]